MSEEDLPQVRISELQREGLHLQILECTRQGMEPGEVTEYLRETESVFVDPRTIGHFLSRLGDGTNEIVQAGMAHELRKLQKTARRRLEKFLRKYDEAEEAFEASGDGEAFERMQFYESRITGWWHNNKDFFEEQGNFSLVLQQTNVEQHDESVNILVEELAKEDPERAEEVIARFEGVDSDADVAP
jgi:hypothetical protein